jgi:hypothetical protein
VRRLVYLLAGNRHSSGGGGTRTINETHPRWSRGRLVVAGAVHHAA